MIPESPAFRRGEYVKFEVLLNDVPSGKRGIAGFSKMLEITPAKITQAKYDEMSAKILALPDTAYGWRIPTAAQISALARKK